LLCNNPGVYENAHELFIADPLFSTDDLAPNFVTEIGRTYESTNPGVKEVNVIANMKKCGKPEKLNLPKKKVAIILGGGPSVQEAVKTKEFFHLKHSHDVVTIGVSDSLKYCLPNYYIGIESSPAGPDRIKDVHYDATTALIHVCGNKGYAEYPWKEMKFFSGFDGTDYGLSKLWTYLTVATEAFQIATRYMGVDHVVLIGFDGAAPEGLGYHVGEKPYPPEYVSRGIDGKYWELSEPMRNVNMAIECAAWLVGMHGIKVWNCSGGVLVNNMYLADIPRFYEWFMAHRDEPRKPPREILGGH
jgi:hypothetical protein